MEHHPDDLAVGEPLPETRQTRPRPGRDRLAALDLDRDEPPVAQLHDDIHFKPVVVAEMGKREHLPAPAALLEQFESDELLDQ